MSEGSGAEVYRIHFTSQDLARTRVADAPMPLMELYFAARALQERSRSAWLGSWRHRARTNLTTQERMTLALIPPVGWSPSFFTPALPGRSDHLLDQVRATSRRQIELELADVAVHQPIPSWTTNLGTDRELRDHLYDGLSLLYERLLAPYWPRFADHLTADRTVRMRQFLTGGVESVLAHANPQWVRWRPPVLEVRMANGADLDVYLEGQGVLLVPSLFSSRTIVDDQNEPQPLVTYPAGQDRPLDRLTLLAPEPAMPGMSGAVAALLGPTRAAVLSSVAEHPGCSTKELASLAGVAPASASEHATTLREAGLIHTVRHRNSALHSPTQLGLALLNGAQQSTTVDRGTGRDRP